MLFMRTILSLLSLATFALAIPVAQPQAVGDLGGVGLIGRASSDAAIQDIDDTVNQALRGAVAASRIAQADVDNLIGIINSDVASGVQEIGTGAGLEQAALDGVLLRVGNSIDDALRGKFEDAFVDQLEVVIDGKVTAILAIPSYCNDAMMAPL